jgi:hypothetical protein
MGNRTATDGVIREQANVFGQQTSVTNSVHKTCTVLQKMRL